MKGIIFDKLYDTATARKIASWNMDIPGKKHLYEILYRKENGEFFLHSTRGVVPECTTIFIENVAFDGDEQILLFNGENEVKEWLMQHADANTYIDLFGDVEE